MSFMQICRLAVVAISSSVAVLAAAEQVPVTLPAYAQAKMTTTQLGSTRVAKQTSPIVQTTQFSAPKQEQAEVQQGAASPLQAARLLDTDVTDAINELIQAELSTANVGWLLMDANTGDVLLQQNAKHVFYPASNAKLFVAAAALYYFPSDFAYATTLRADLSQLRKGQLQGNVAVTFVGDPSLRSADIHQLFAELSQRGVESIRGDVVIDDSAFVVPSRPHGYSLDDVPMYFSAPVSSIILDENRMKIRLDAGERVGQPTSATPLAQNDWLHVRHDIRTVSGGYAADHCELIIKVNEQNDVDVSGCWSVNQKSAEKWLALQNPAYRAKQVIREALQASHLTLRGKIVVSTARARSMPDASVVAKHLSPPMSALVKQMMKDSDNLYADAILKTLGQYHHKQGSFIEGVNALKTILRQKAKIKPESIQLADGSGSRYNLVSPTTIGQLLFQTFHSVKIKRAFVDSMPIAQSDGTLAWRFAEKALPGKIIAKTGTMQDTSSLSGYFWTTRGEPFIFSIMINNVLGDIHQAKEVEESLVLLMMRATDRGLPS